MGTRSTFCLADRAKSRGKGLIFDVIKHRALLPSTLQKYLIPTWDYLRGIVYNLIFKCFFHFAFITLTIHTTNSITQDQPEGGEEYVTQHNVSDLIPEI